MSPQLLTQTLTKITSHNTTARLCSKTPSSPDVRENLNRKTTRIAAACTYIYIYMPAHNSNHIPRWQRNIQTCTRRRLISSNIVMLSTSTCYDVTKYRPSTDIVEEVDQKSNWQIRVLERFTRLHRHCRTTVRRGSLSRSSRHPLHVSGLLNNILGRVESVQFRKATAEVGDWLLT